MFRDSSGDTPALALAEAYRALDEGDSPEARGLAQSALIAAKASGDVGTQAQALACLAHCDRVSARLRRATDASRRAAQLFQETEDSEGEASALNTLAQVSMLLGRNDEAVESALLSVRLSDLRTPTPQAVLAHNCLGIAYCWSGDFEKANASLETAIELCTRCDPPESPYQPKMNQLWVEAARLSEERYQTGAMGSLKEMARLVKACRQLERNGDAEKVLPGLQPMGKTVSEVMKGLYAAWSGDFENAQIYSDRAVGSLGGTVTWLDALVRWSLAELAWARHDWTGAERGLAEMKSLAVSVEHEQLACTAHLLLAQVFEQQGKNELARREHRALRARERYMARESLSSREAVVSWRLGARLSQRHLEQALLASRQFERWSFEDALTGIANRRLFEKVLSERLSGNSAAGKPLTVAMLDLDDFKSVNDTHGHQVGDRVLKTVASILANLVRGDDLAARLAGDEFVILFDGAEQALAVEICDRVREAVTEFDWGSLAAGLHVTVSIGVGEAIAGDTVDALVHRSDKSMYSVKTGWEHSTH